VGLLIGPLHAVVTRYHAIVIKFDPLGFLVEAIAHWDVEVGDLPVVECVAGGGFVEGLLIVEYALLEVVELVFVPFVQYCGSGLSVSDGL
jgi:hypothetical protein